MTNPLSRTWLYVISGVYLALAAVCLYFDFIYILLLPAVLVAIWLAFFKLENLLFFVVMCTPLSLSIEKFSAGGIGMYLPTEPLLAGILLLFLFKTLTGKSIDPVIFKHPISILLYCYLVWMLLTTITSEYPLVSIKYVLTRMWFIASMYFIATHIFRDLKKVQLYFLLYLFPLCVVIIYTISRHAQHAFDKDSSHWVMEPLFKDHTSYGAVLAMYFPIIIGMLMKKNMNLLLRIALSLVFLLLTTGLILSYTRAAWVSIIAAAAILLVMLVGIKLRTIALTFLVLGGFVYFGWDDIQISLKSNKQESSDKLGEHVGSISNVSSDASNLERLNRWNCAWEMFKERPLVGWGPGTYQFVYAPFQRSKDRTIISTNQGDGGNAHSEYLGPLCEQGVAGLILVIALLFMVSSLAFKLFYRHHERDIKILIASSYLGLMTYFIHGVLNNYLDTDKASIPFWGFIAILVSIDIYHRKNPAKLPAQK
jgi:putative inorganic carbon (HCO3(-)) transporter